MVYSAMLTQDENKIMLHRQQHGYEEIFRESKGSVHGLNDNLVGDFDHTVIV
jgi:hypothetical protein